MKDSFELGCTMLPVLHYYYADMYILYNYTAATTV